MRIFAVIYFLYMLCSCTPHELDPAGYVKWIKDESNGLRTSKEMGNFEFALQYKPAEFIAITEDGIGNVRADSVNKRVKELDGLQYYTLTITSKENKEVIRTGVTSEEEFFQRMEYLTSAMQDDLWLIDGKDTLPCRLFHFERNYQLAPYNKVVLAFDNLSSANDRTLLYDDRALGTGPVKMTIKAGALSNIPQLKVN